MRAVKFGSVELKLYELGSGAGYVVSDLTQAQVETLQNHTQSPIPMRLHCPACHAQHVDAGEFATKPHHTHACQSCGMVWRPAIVPTVGVQFLPGFKDEEN